MSMESEGATNANGRGVGLVGTSTKFTFSNSEMNVGNRGIGVVNSCDTNSYITISNSVIKNSQLPAGQTYETWARYGDTRGISLWDMDNAEVTISNSEILGFGYTINLAGTLVDGIRDYDGTTVNVTDSKLMGWTAFNVWSSDTTFNITNSYLKGINNSNGPTDGFATIVVNDDIYGYGWGSTKANMFYITGGTITNYRSGSASEQLFRVDDEGITEVTFSELEVDEWTTEKVTIIDGTGDSNSVFYSGYLMTPDGWINYMTQRVHGEGVCEVTGYNGQTLPFIPA